MKKVVLVVASLFVLLVVFSFLGFTPSNKLSGSAIYYPEASFCSTKYKESGHGQPDQSSDCYEQVLERRRASYADIDMTKYYDNHFELKPGDNLLIDNTYMFKFFRGFVREWVAESNNVPNYESQISVVRILQNNYISDVIVRTVKKRDEIVVFDRLNMIMDWVIDIDEQSNVDDRAQFIFPTSVNIVYNPTLELGDQVNVNGKLVELVGYKKDFEPTADIENGFVDLRVDGKIYALYSFDKSDIGGLKVSVDKVNTASKEISLMFYDAKTVELLE